MIWLEILHRGREVRQRQRLDGTGPLRIGRGYDNDIVIDDPHIAEHHLSIELDGDGRWIARDLGSLNGLWTQGPKRRVGTAPLDADHPVRIGNTWLRVRSTRNPVAAERPMQSHGIIVANVVMLAALLALGALDQWRSQISKPEIADYSGQAVQVLVMVFGWSGIWALINRVFTHQTHFAQHMRIALIAGLVLDIVDLLLPIGAYAWSAPGLLKSQELLTLGVAALAIARHVLLIEPKHPLSITTGCLLAAAAFFGLNRLNVLRHDDAIGPHPVLSELMPPAWRQVDPEPIQDFMAGLPALLPELEEAREEALEEYEESADDDLDDVEPAQPPDDAPLPTEPGDTTDS